MQREFDRDTRETGRVEREERDMEDTYIYIYIYRGEKYRIGEREFERRQGDFGRDMESTGVVYNDPSIAFSYEND
eukprot:1393410-Amorphochlora_amoeboformis.AAC.1